MNSEEELLLSTSRFRVVRVAAEDAGGRRVREVVRHPGSAVILPWVDRQHICLIRNQRVAVGRTLIELPTGTLTPGEDPAATARRELAEETGFVAGRLELLVSFYVSPGILDERMHLFVATQLTAGPPHREAQERIENVIVPWEEALAMIDDGRIEDAKTMLGLLYYQRRHARAQ